MKVVAGYVPVIQKGYLDFFQKYSDAKALFLFSKGLIAEVDHLRKDLRALEPEQAVQAIKGLGIFPTVEVAEAEDLLNIKEDCTIIMPNEEISRHVAEKHLSGREVQFDNVFMLRWDPKTTVAERPVQPDRKISSSDFDKEMMRLAFREAESSSDFWRRIGALLVKDGEIVISAHNCGVPSEHTVYIWGDPRSNFKKGLKLEISSFEHAEAVVIGEAAKHGISTQGSDLYVTTFPCPPCGKLVGRAGIKRLFYQIGYAVLSAEDDLRSYGTEIIYVE